MKERNEHSLSQMESEVTRWRRFRKTLPASVIKRIYRACVDKGADPSDPWSTARIVAMLNSCAATPPDFISDNLYNGIIGGHKHV